MFGLFSMDAREQNDGQVSAPRSNSHTEAQWPVPTHPGSAGIPDLPAGMLSVYAKAGDFLMIPCASPRPACIVLPSPDPTWPAGAGRPWCTPRCRGYQRTGRGGCCCCASSPSTPAVHASRRRSCNAWLPKRARSRSCGARGRCGRWRPSRAARGCDRKKTMITVPIPLLI